MGQLERKLREKENALTESDKRVAAQKEEIAVQKEEIGPLNERLKVTEEKLQKDESIIKSWAGPDPSPTPVEKIIQDLEDDLRKTQTELAEEKYLNETLKARLDEAQRKLNATGAAKKSDKTGSPGRK